MPLTSTDFDSIYAAIEQRVTKQGEYLLVSEVIKSDPLNNLIWVPECGDQPIPIFDFDYEVKYYDTTQTGTVVEKKAKISVATPNVGDIVLIALERGTRRLPRCLGRLQSRNFISTSLDEA